jgi:hypothetical protein
MAKSVTAREPFLSAGSPEDLSGQTRMSETKVFVPGLDRRISSATGFTNPLAEP